MSSLLVVGAADVEKALDNATSTDLANLMGCVFTRISSPASAATEISLPKRISIETPNHTVLFMPGRITSLGTAIKVVSVPSSAEDKRGLPASTMVLDEDTGAVRALVNASSLTAYRTAAGSLLSTRLLLGSNAKPDSILVFGSGKQIEAHIDLHLRAYSSIERVAIVNRTVPRATGLMTRLLPRHPTVQFTATALEGNNFRTFLSNAAIIIAATSSTTPLFGEDERFVRTGAHIILVGSYKPEMQEVSGELLHRSGNRLPGSQMRVVVDSREACLKEAGELIRTGVSPEDLVEIGELVSESEDGNLVVNEEKCEAVRAAGDITIFKSVGVGVQDVAITDYVVRRVEEAGLGTVVQNYYS